MLSVLRQRNFALLWLGGLISMSGDWVLVAALPYFVFKVTGSALATSTILVVDIAPFFLFGSLAGTLVDRWDRKRVMVVSNLLQTVIVLLLLLVRSGDLLWIVYVLAFLQSSVSVFFAPAEGAFIPRVVREEHLIQANSLKSVSSNIARLGGPPVGGALFGAFGLPAVVFADSASFLIAAILLASIVVQSERAEEQEVLGQIQESFVQKGVSVWHDWLDGFDLVRSNSLVTVLFVTVGTATVGDGTYNALLVPFVAEGLRAPDAVFGWMITASGMGGLVGGILIGWLGGRLNPSHLLWLSQLNIGMLILLMVNLRVVLLAVALSALMGLPSMGWGISQGTLLQTSVSDNYRGRVLGFFGTANALIRLTGLLLSGVVADIVGIFPLLNAAGAFWVSAGLLGLILFRSIKYGQ